MKTRILVIILLLLFLTVVITNKDGRIVNMLLSVINPIKQTYTNVTKEVENKSQSYVYQKKNIQKLLRENKYLRKRLLEQKHYIKQVRDLYSKIPTLEKMPRNSVDIVQTISYVKLNTFSQVILTKPRHFKGIKEKLYGLIQGDVAAGVAHVENNNLYGALVSSDKCRFSVFVGKGRAAGIAIGVNTRQMQVKFIPKWAKIIRGDKVFTSGLDSIFFANIPVGVVERVKVESSYKVAYIKPYADILHPDYFYLVKDPAVSLTSKFDGRYICDCNKSAAAFDQNLTADQNGTADDLNQTLEEMQEPYVSSIPSVLPEEPKKIIQTQEEVVSSEQLEPPVEPHRQPVKKKKKKAKRPKVENLDLF
jgi:rod shape-determining protein MreC